MGDVTILARSFGCSKVRYSRSSWVWRARYGGQAAALRARARKGLWFAVGANVALFLTSLTPVAALAQAPARPVTPTAQQNLLSSDQFIQSAVAVLRALEANGAASIYDGSSAVMKRAVKRAAFVQAVNAQLVRTGRAVAFDWGRVERTAIGPQPTAAGQAAPPHGNFVTVYVVVRTAQNAGHVEQVSFRLDEDNQWRLAGVAALSPGAPVALSPNSK